MKSILHKKLFVIAAFALASTMFQGVVSAQTSGVGNDGYTRILWRGTDGSISMWKLDANVNYVTYHAYGPYDGYTPIALTTAGNNYSYVLWRNTDGSISLWEVDPNLNYVNSKVFG